MLSIIYPYRNRDLERIKNSFESLKNQTILDFEVFFVDYGSNIDIAKEVNELCNKYYFISYYFHPSQDQPWNKSKALNSVIKTLKTEYFFVADVDMIFHPQFVEKAIKLQKCNKITYFQVGFLSSDTKKINGKYTFNSSYRKSTSGATGLTMFPVNIIKELGGFDEFYHFWGSEDTDMLERIKNAGYQVDFFDEAILMLHQWHLSYRANESLNLTQNLQIRGIVQLNHQHLKYSIKNKKTKVNLENWGECISQEEVDILSNAPISLVQDNEKCKIDHLLFNVLPNGSSGETLKVLIKKDAFQNSKKYWVKRILYKKVPKYYTLKQINDKMLLHLITFYRNRPYSVKISDDLKNIELAIIFL
mgnify:CR=1 FL=1|tara:strand:+ start:2078 stop:3160 length:1083 start_codon:yes stop_codon:yes gene_type:complete